MSNGSKMDYGYGNKAQWRRTVWNRIVDKLTVPPRDAVVLYLAGEKDLDREVALRKGFRDCNLIAIEKHKGVCKTLRESGTLTINGDLNTVVESWSSPKIDVLFADFCCGFLEQVSLLSGSLAFNKIFGSSVLMFNIMRGRESKDQPMRLFKHRASNAISDNYCQCRQAFTGVKMLDSSTSEKELVFDEWFKNQDEPSTGFYRSSKGMYFDWAVWRNFNVHRVAYESIIVEGRDLSGKSFAPLFAELELNKPIISHSAYLAALTYLNELKVNHEAEFVNGCSDLYSKYLPNKVARKQSPMTRQIAAVKAHRSIRLEKFIATTN